MTAAIILRKIVLNINRIIAFHGGCGCGCAKVMAVVEEHLNLPNTYLVCILLKKNDFSIQECR